MKKIVIVGGVAGGASAATRARRLCESCDIIVFDRGPYVSFANCGLPYHVGDVIREERDLIIATPERFKQRFNIDVRVRSDVEAIDRGAQKVRVRDITTGRTYDESYSELILSPGAQAIRPPIPGVELPGVFVLRTIPDSRELRAWIDERQAKRAVIIGAGFIGLEVAENLVRRGLDVTVVELADQVLPPIDAELAHIIAGELTHHGVQLHLGDAVTNVAGFDGRLTLTTKQQRTLNADLVVLSVGVRPEVGLAQRAGLVLGERGGIRVDAEMRTSDPHVFAVGDAVEVYDFVLGTPAVVPLAGPANRQGRIAADVIFGRPARFRGVQGTAVCRVFDLTVACTGASEKALRRSGVADFESVALHPGHHVSYFPGAKPIHMKLLFRRSDRRVLGAQAVGEQGVERRIDVLAMALQLRATVDDVADAELCYAPQFGAAKDPVNFAGMIASNVMDGLMPIAHWEDVAKPGHQLVDVRSASEFASGAVPGAINIPLEELRSRIAELDQSRELWLYCGVGQRAYYATRLLEQHGFSVRNLPGGYLTFEMKQAAAQLKGQVASMGGLPS